MSKTLKVTYIKGLNKKKLLLAGIILPVLLFLFTLSHESRPAGSLTGDGPFRIGNKYVKLEYDPVQNTFKMKNLRSGRDYFTESVTGCVTTGIRLIGSNGMEITQSYDAKYGGLVLVSDVTLEDDRIKVVMKAGKDVPLSEPIPFPGAFCGEEERQYFAIPYAEGICVSADEKCDFGEFEMWGHKSTMPFVGMTDLKTGIMITSDTPCDTSVAFVKAASPGRANYLMRLEHYPAKEKFEYDRIFYIDFIENDGYNEMAKKFRKHLENKQRYKTAGEPDVLVTLRDKLKDNPGVERLIGAVDFWLGPQSMKRTSVIDDLISHGVDKALINFQYGWKIYDDEKRPLVVKYAADRGLLPSRYDNYADIFEPDVLNISPRFRTEGFLEGVIIKGDGGFQEGYGSYYKGRYVQGYRLNTGFSERDVDSYLQQDLSENSYMGRFVDVSVSCRLYEDYSQSHPMRRTEDMLNRVGLLKKISSRYGMITGTEETAWWAVPVTHYSEGTLTIAPVEGAGDGWTAPTDQPGSLYEAYTVNPYVRIPLKSLVYHDCHVSGWYTGDSMSRVMKYWKTKDLITVLYGAMGLAFPDSDENWERYREEYLRSIIITGWVFEKVGYEKMERHEFISSDRLVQRTTFSNGVTVTVNFSDSPYKDSDTTIPPSDFIVRDGGKVYTSEWIASHKQ